MLKRIIDLVTVTLIGALVAMIFPINLLAGIATYMVWGDPCPEGSKLERPYSVLFVDADTGEITHLEYVNCAGERSWGWPQSDGVVQKYQAYESYLNRAHDPAVSLGYDSSLFVIIDTASKIEVRNGYDGTLLKSLPAAGTGYTTTYVINKADLKTVVNKPVVVDVIRPSDNSYQGTATHIYKP